VYATEQAQFLVQQGDDNFATWMSRIYIKIGDIRQNTGCEKKRVLFI
jgi:hypothetical protein